MYKYNIIFRVDSGKIIGTGHIQRCLNLANQFDNSNIYFICKEFEGNLISTITKSYKVFKIDGKYDEYININNTNTWLGEKYEFDAVKTLDIIQKNGKFNLLIVDHYGIDDKWEKYIYPYVNNLFVIDDFYRSHYCDIIQNSHIYKPYDNINKKCVQLLGSEYIILNKEISDIKIKNISKLKRINISLGGADYTNESLKIIKACDDLNYDIIYDIVLGKANPNINIILDYCKNKNKFKIHIDLDNKNFLNLLNECDLSIGGAGMTSYERCILNKPFIYLLMADNQLKLCEKIKYLNIGVYLGNIKENYIDNLKKQIKLCFDDKQYLIVLSENCYKLANIKNIYKLKNTLLKYMQEENIEKIQKTLPYGKQFLDEDDIQAVIDVLKENNFLTTGPKVTEFEEKVAKKTNLKYGIACSNGTAALHLACLALDIKNGDEVIVPAISFVASSNCVLYCGGKPIFCDIDEETMCIDPKKIENLITAKTKAIIAVDFAGQLCDYDKIKKIADKYNLYLIEDAAHAIGHEKYYGDIITFSFHPVKHITTGEGGMTLTNNENFAKKMKLFRTHGITKDFKERESTNEHYYEMIELGFNYRISDILCALGISQLNKLDKFIKRRQEIAKIYDLHFGKFALQNKFNNVYHLYIIKLPKVVDRDKIFKELKNMNIGVNVHYMPIYLHPYYKKLDYKDGLCPIAEKIYKNIITLPLFPEMTDNDIMRVIKNINNVL